MYISVDQAVKILLQGGIIAFPTETVYGLGAVATNKDAVEKVYQAKKRPSDNPLICHFFSVTQIRKYIPKLPETAKVLFKEFSPGPISILLNLPENSPLLPATRGRPSVICRIPNHPDALKLIKKVNRPIAAPSANISGKMSATSAEMVEKDLGDEIDGVIDGGLSEVGLESTIIDCREPGIVTILRPGAIGKQELEHALDEAHKAEKIKEVTTVRTEQESPTEVTPGSKYPHYAPKTPIAIVKDLSEIPEGKELIAVLATKERLHELAVPYNDSASSTLQGGIQYLSLGSIHDLNGVAHDLYRKFYELDQLDVPEAFLIDEDWGTSSIALAIKNRLKKVSV